VRISAVREDHAKANSRAALSLLAAASLVPSGLNAAAWTVLSWRIRASSRPVSASRGLGAPTATGAELTRRARAWTANRPTQHAFFACDRMTISWPAITAGAGGSPGAFQYGLAEFASKLVSPSR
jgi:hypothetical protein